MIFISHRGNIQGKKPYRENHPDYIYRAYSKGFDVEIDVWYIDKNILLGHDRPVYPISNDFIKQKFLWCHAKNWEALEFLMKRNIRCFWHTNEDYILTSYGDIWVFPGKILLSNSIAVLPEQTNYNIENIKKCKAVCSDNILKYKDILI